MPVIVQTPQGMIELMVVAYAGPDGSAYHFIVALGPDGAPAALGDLFRSFRLLSEQEAKRLRPRTIEVVTVGAGDTLQSLAQHMASEHPVDHFLMLNGRSAGQPAKPGERVKIITYDAG
jgi:predicted Zn-dependent protease